MEVLKPGNRRRIVFWPPSIELHPILISEMIIQTLQELCVCVKPDVYFYLFFFHVHSESLELRDDCRAKAKKCKSLRIRSDGFTLLFQLEGWSYQRAVAVWNRRRRQAYVVVHLPYLQPPLLLQKTHINFTIFWCVLNTWSDEEKRTPAMPEWEVTHKLCLSLWRSFLCISAVSCF